MILSVSQLLATDYYVDKNAPGANNGLSWTHAWESFADINWGILSPGDNIYISGGSTSKTYNETLAPQCKGTAGNPITFIVGKYAPSPSGHDGRVIISGGDAGISFPDYSGTIGAYLTFKGFEITDVVAGVYYNSDGGRSSNSLIFDSLDIYGYTGQAGIKFECDPYDVVGIEIKNCSIIAPDLSSGETDGMFFKGVQNTLISNNYVHIPNQDPDQHVNCLQAYLCDGWVIKNNVFINDSVNSPEGGGAPIILSSETTNYPAIFYNNFLYLGGVWYLPKDEANTGTTFLPRRYGGTIANGWAIHNTIITNGPKVRNVEMEYYISMLNNILAMYCIESRDSDMEENFSIYNMGKDMQVDSVRNNLFWREDSVDIIFSGNSPSTDFVGDATGIPSGWTDWINNYGGTGLFRNPMLVKNIGYESVQGDLNGELQSSSPAIDAGEDLENFIYWLNDTYSLEGDWALEWKDINGVNRDNTPDIGAYQYAVGSPDTIPSWSGAFIDVINAELSTEYISNTLTATNFDSCWAYANGSDFRINSGSWITVRTKIYGDDTIEVRQTSSGSNNTATDVVFTASTFEDTYTVTTKSAGGVSQTNYDQLLLKK